MRVLFNYCILHVPVRYEVKIDSNFGKRRTGISPASSFIVCVWCICMCIEEKERKREREKLEFLNIGNLGCQQLYAFAG